MKISTSLRKLIALFMVCLHLVVSLPAFAGDDDDEDSDITSETPAYQMEIGADDDDSGGDNRGDWSIHNGIPDGTKIGDVITYANAQWICTKEITYDGKTLPFFVHYDQQAGVEQVLSAADAAGLSGAASPNSPSANVGAGADPASAQGFEGWRERVAGYLADPASSQAPFETGPPIPVYSIPPINQKYLSSTDDLIHQSLVKTAQVQGNLEAFEIAEMNAALKASSWQCAECTSDSGASDFSQEAQGAARAVSGVGSFATSPYSPGTGGTGGLDHYSLTMPRGADRDQLFAIYSQLISTTPTSMQGQTAKVIGLHAVVHADAAATKGDQENFKINKKIALAMVDIVIGLSPAGIAKDAYEAISGRGLLDGHKLSSVERGAAIFGVVSIGLLAKLGAFSKIASAISTLSKETRGGEAAIDAITKTVEVAIESGVANKQGLTQFGEAAGRMLGKSFEDIGAAVKFAGPVGERSWADLYKAVSSLPQGLELHVLPGAGEGYAIVGRMMKDGTTLGVNSVASKIAESGLEIRAFSPSGEAIVGLKRASDKIGGDKVVGDALRETAMWAENVKWVNDMKAEGRTFIDLGNPNRATDVSEFYEMEQKLIFGEVLR